VLEYRYRRKEGGSIPQARNQSSQKGGTRAASFVTGRRGEADQLRETQKKTGDYEHPNNEVPCGQHWGLREGKSQKGGGTLRKKTNN